MAPLAMEMVRDIDEDTVNFAPNYDGRAGVISADHAVQATERYRTDKVKQPVQLKTSKLAAAQAPTN